MKELWEIDKCIPLKDSNLVELIRGVVLWYLWLERNIIIFRTCQGRNIKGIGAQILCTAHFWCKN